MSTTFEQTTLDNGLTVIAETRDHAHTAAVGFFVKAGARDEHPRQMGVSHFLEHMMFKGSDRRTADDVNREFDEMGADYNAYTSDEMTVYYARVLPEHLSHAVDLLGDMLRPALRETDFEMEKKVILEEIGMYEDRPMWRLHDALMETHFGRHPLGHRVLGTSETVSALSAEQMRDYFQQRYGPDQITVAAAGAVDFDRLVADIEKAAGHWTPSGAQRDYLDPAPDAGELTLTDKAIEQHYFAVMTPGPSARDPQRYAARILADVLGDSDGSRLYWELVDPGLADDADVTFAPHDGAGNFIAFASCSPKHADAVEKAVVTALDQADQNLDPEEIERAANKLATAITLTAENPRGRMSELGTQWAYLGRMLPVDEQIDAVRSVTADDLKNLATAYDHFGPRTLARLTPAS